MATYNAIVKQSQRRPQIIGRTLISYLPDVPDEWTVLFRNVVISSSTDIGKLMCSSKEPLIIYKEYETVNKVETVVKASTSKFSRAKIDLTTQQEEETRLLRQQNIPNPEIKNDHRKRIGFGCSARLSQQISKHTLYYFGIPTSNIWNAYGMGINLVGECPNRQCESNGSNTQVIYQSGYGEVSLTTDNHKFPCPACQTLFPVTKFLVCMGRSLFRFKKSETIDNEIETVILESPGPVDQYSTFDNRDDRRLVNYEFIEITTIEPGSSFYYCIVCDEHIEDAEDEIILGCGHPYHKSTCGANMTNCMVCESTPFDSIYCLLTVNTEKETGSL